MENLRGINIKHEDLFWLRKLGTGRDATVYAVPGDKAYKVYKEPNKPNYKKVLEMIQKNNYDIKESHLPKCALYIDGKFNGCVLDRIHGFQIHKIFPALTRKQQVIILKKIVSAVKELTDHNIYPADLANTPFLPGKRSNVLLDYHLIPQLIDIDGSGAEYCDLKDNNNESFTHMALNMLILDLMFGEPVLEDPEYSDMDYLLYRLTECGFDKYVSQKLVKYEANYKDLDKVIDEYATLKRVR